MGLADRDYMKRDKGAAGRATGIRQQGGKRQGGAPLLQRIKFAIWSLFRRP